MEIGAGVAPDDESIDNVEPSVSEPLVVDERDWAGELKRAGEAAAGLDEYRPNNLPCHAVCETFSSK